MEGKIKIQKMKFPGNLLENSPEELGPAINIVLG